MKYFTLDELSRSSTAEKNNIKNKPTTDDIVALTALVDNILDPARQKIGAPITVTSGYRCPQLNRLVGGSPPSQHTRGEAADLTMASGKENLQLARVIYKLGTFDQLIIENADPSVTQCQWVHVSYSRSGNRRQVLVKHKGQKGYKPYNLA